MKSIQFEDGCCVRLPVDVQKKRLHRVITDMLTEKQREVLVAYYFQDLSVTEIARERNINKSTVWRTLQRAEARIRRCLCY